MQGQFFGMFNGHIGSEPKITDFENGGCIANFSVATKHIWIDNLGEKQERTYWVNCVTYGKLANLVANCVSSGKPIMVTQSYPELVEWTDRTTGIQRSATRFIVQALQFLDYAPIERPHAPSEEETNGSVHTNHVAVQTAPTHTTRPARTGNGVRKFGKSTTIVDTIPEVITTVQQSVSEQQLEDVVNTAPRTGAGKSRSRNKNLVPASTTATPVIVVPFHLNLNDDLLF